MACAFHNRAFLPFNVVPKRYPGEDAHHKPAGGQLTPDTRRMLRQLFVAVCFVIMHVLLDRSTIPLQIWNEISAWYPPTGLALAVLIAFGPRYALPILIAENIASILNYHLPVYSFSFLVGNIEFVATYTSAALILRNVVKIDRQLRSLRYVMWLLLVAILSSCLAAFAGTGFLVLDHLIHSREYLQATFNWWVGDAVAIGSITPFVSSMCCPGSGGLRAIPNLPGPAWISPQLCWADTTCKESAERRSRDYSRCASSRRCGWR